ncbi:MAG: Undecaprenyl-phosphate galactose phosphotransferase [Deltaproteobacteria bacterium]|nr:Undecaprenyl-phosphate galactose phosphotransferase [Deltaproteobacteria bacterium]
MWYFFKKGMVFYKESQPEMKILNLLQKKNSSQINNGDYGKYRLRVTNTAVNLYPEKYFLNFLRLERKRSERSRRSFMLVIIGLKGFSKTAERRETVKDIASVISSTTRDIDMKGWYKNNESIGIMFNEISSHNAKNFQAEQQYTLNKVCENLTEYLGLARFDRLEISYQIFPGDFVMLSRAKPSDLSQYPNLVLPPAKKAAFTLKRMIDIVGSLCAIILFAPVFLLVGVLIKTNSPGGVFFRQERVGLYGKKFMFLKFRSMHVNNDPTIHKEFVRNLIQGNKVDHVQSVGAQQAKDFKIKDDPRVTSIGRFIRRTSIDELPQFFNVLKGDMSLVGPRPPIPYECEEYDIWHRSRVLDMKPGITSLWQVDGRSATSFDDMVRMDIRYVREWSLLLDIKILFKTPLVVLTCKGAY